MDKNKYNVDESVSKKELANVRRNKYLKIFIFVGIIVFIVVIIVLNIIDNDKQMKEANTLINSKQCDKAVKIYKELNQESKNSDKINKCYYENAIEFYDNEEYENAYKLFEKLSGYKDSDKYYESSRFNYSKYLLDNAQYDEAIKILYDMQDYENSKDLLNEAKAKLIKNAKVGDIVYLGEFEQDGNSNNGKEPIEWIVLSKSNDDVLIISNYILEKMRFGFSYLWEKSEVREWLNNDFLHESFSESEIKYIQEMITSDKTNDMIFCLSAEEARLLFSSDEKRIAKPTEKLINEGFKLSTNKAGDWWTRSVSTASNGKGVVPVESNGNVRSAGTNELAPEEYTYVDIGVRPSISINVNSVSSDAINMDIYGHDSNTGLDNEPNISSNSSPTTKKTNKCSGGAVGCRSGFHPCNPNKNNYCVSCCKSN